MGRNKFKTSTNMKTIGLMLKITRNIFITGKAVIIEIDLYVLKGISHIRKGGRVM